MSIRDIKPGDRLDWPAHELHDGEVTRVGRATVWLVYRLNDGRLLPVTADPANLRPHVAPDRLQIGDFVIRNQGGGFVWLDRKSTGEGMQTDTARLEAALEKFWRREF